MDAQRTRPGGRFLMREREAAMPELAEQIKPVAAPQRWPLPCMARIEAGALIYMARRCDLTVEKFCERYQ